MHQGDVYLVVLPLSSPYSNFHANFVLGGRTLVSAIGISLCDFFCMFCTLLALPVFHYGFRDLYKTNLFVFVVPFEIYSLDSMMLFKMMNSLS